MYFAVPQTPLPSLDILKEDKDNWTEVQQNMGKALDEMRINWDSQFKIKKLTTTNNPLFERRMKKTKTDQTLSNAEQKVPTLGITIQSELRQTTITNQDMVVEDFCREPSVVSMTPTNSRPSSPKWPRS